MLIYLQRFTRISVATGFSLFLLTSCFIFSPFFFPTSGHRGPSEPPLALLGPPALTGLRDASGPLPGPPGSQAPIQSVGCMGLSPALSIIIRKLHKLKLLHQDLAV
jgi:hypothetical protein